MTRIKNPRTWTESWLKSMGRFEDEITAQFVENEQVVIHTFRQWAAGTYSSAYRFDLANDGTYTLASIKPL